MNFMSIFFFKKIFNIKNKLFFTLLSIFIFRFGCYIPIPGVNIHLLSHILSSKSNVIFDLFNIFSGGSLFHISIFALGVIPYILSTIIMQLLSVTCSYFIQLNKEGHYGQFILHKYTRYLTLCIAFIQAIIFLLSFIKINRFIRIIDSLDYIFCFTFIITLLIGSMFLLWLGKQISKKGISNGVSLIILTGILSNSSFLYFFTRYCKSVKLVISMFCFLLCLVFIIVFIEKAQRKILVQYFCKNNLNNECNIQHDKIYFPLKVNVSGIMPSIFSSSLMILPAYGFLYLNKLVDFKHILFIKILFNPGHYLYIIVNMLLVVLFCFFYNFLIFNPKDIASSLNKSSIYIIGIYPGNRTKYYISNIVYRLTLFNAIYLCIICFFPYLIHEILGISLYISGTSLLMVVVIILDILDKVESFTNLKYYSFLLNINKIYL